jgi:ATP-binding cassette subfamily B protein
MTDTTPAIAASAPSVAVDGTAGRAESVLPELRTMFVGWDPGMQARATAGTWAVLAELPRLVQAALVISWRTDRRRTVVIAAATPSAN